MVSPTAVTDGDCAGWVGKQAHPPAVARDPVNQPMIRRWAEAMGDANPLWHDPATRRAFGHDRAVAPPAMLDVWTMPPFRPTGRREDEAFAAHAFLQDAGYTHSIATNVEQEYLRYLVEGDVISFRSVHSDISAEKHTSLGVGRFVTLAYDFSDQVGALVGRMRFRLLQYRSPDGDPSQTGRPAPDLPVEASNQPISSEPVMSAKRLEDCRPGVELPPLVLPVTASLIAVGAIATNDFETIHHDAAAARGMGMKDIFMNILTTNGLVQRYATDWAGAGARIRGIALRLGAPNYPGDMMVLRGAIAAVDEAEKTAQLHITGRNSQGDHVVATLAMGFAETAGRG